MTCVKHAAHTKDTFMKQMTLAVSGFESHGKQSRKAEFLARMDKLVPWAEFCSVIAPYYPKAGNGRPPI